MRAPSPEDFASPAEAVRKHLDAVASAGPRIVRAGKLLQRSGKSRWRERQWELVDSGELKQRPRVLVEGRRGGATWHLDARCAVRPVEATGANERPPRRLFAFTVEWPEDAPSRTRAGRRPRGAGRRDGSESENESSDGDDDDAPAPEPRGRRTYGRGLLGAGAASAAVTAGGVAVGVVTFGVGLIPYAAFVGALASSGAYLRLSKAPPPPRSLTLACGDEGLAGRWRAAVRATVDGLAPAKRAAPAGDDAATPRSAALRLGRAHVVSRCAATGASVCGAAVDAPPLRALVALLGGEKQAWARRGGVVRSVRQLRREDDLSDVAALDLAPLAPPARSCAGAARAAWLAARARDWRRLPGDLWALAYALAVALAAVVAGLPVVAPWLAPLAAGLPRALAVAPRTLVVKRVWRVDDDGAFLVSLATDDALVAAGAEATPGASLRAVFAVAPALDGGDACRLEARVLFDGGGALSGRSRAARALNGLVADALASAVVDLAEALDDGAAAPPPPPPPPPAAAAAPRPPASLDDRHAALVAARSRLELRVVQASGADRRAAARDLQQVLQELNGLARDGATPGAGAAAPPPPPEAAADDLDDACWAVDWDDPGEDLAGAAADLWRRHPAARAEAEGGARDGPVARDDGDDWTLTPVRGAAAPREEAPPQPADDDGLFYTLVGVVAVTVLACRAAS